MLVSSVRMRLKVFAAIYISAASAALAASGEPPRGMSLQGSFSVSRTGAAEYRIPIDLPNGKGNVQPKLAFSYNSQVGNGLLGVGWALDGLSYITRCSQTAAQDGSGWVSAPSYKSTDRFCLDGKRLLNKPAPASDALGLFTYGLASGGSLGAYGADQTYYSPEKEDFSRIQSIGTIVSTNPTFPGSAPSYFKVSSKSGLTFEYGNSLDSKGYFCDSEICRTVPRLWALSKVSDVYGNSYSITYASEVGSLGMRPSKITYTCAGAEVTVNFIYNKSASGQDDFRNDPQKAVDNGSYYSYKSRLNRVRVDLGGAIYAEYFLSYQYNSVTAQSELVSVEKINGGKGKLTFDRNTYSGQFVRQRSATNVGEYNIIMAPRRWFAGDLNGDGLPDLMGVVNASTGFGTGTGYVNVMINSAGNSFVPQQWIVDTGAYISSQKWVMGDFNGDGKIDIGKIWPAYNPDSNTDQAVIDVFLSNGVGFTKQRWGTSQGDFWADQKWLLGDANGDGLPDIIKVFKDGPSTSVDVHLNTGSSFVMQRWATQIAAYNSSSNWFVIDLNKDGRSDVVGEYLTTAPCQFGSGSTQCVSANDVMLIAGVNSSYAKAPDFVSGIYQTGLSGNLMIPTVMVGDFNGDGVDDWAGLKYSNLVGTVWSESVNANLCSSGTGKCTANIYTSAAGGVYRNKARFFGGDINQDGMTDVMSVGEDSSSGSAKTSITAYLSRPNDQAGGFSAQQWMTNNGDYFDEQQWFMVDVDGDGAADFIDMFKDNGKVSIDVIKSSVGDHRIRKFKQAGFSDVTVEYSTLTKSIGTNYEVGGVASYPYVNLVSPIPIVISSSESNGIGGVRTTRYKYGGALASVGAGGRGFLGFAWMQLKDDSTGLVSRTYYKQYWPYTGLVDKETRGTSEANWSDLGVTQYKYDCLPDGLSQIVNLCTLQAGRKYYVFPWTIESVGNKELTATGGVGSGMPGKRVTYVMNSWGNQSSITEEVLNPDGSFSGYKKITENTYSAPDLAKWQLQRVLKTKVDLTTP